MPATTSHTPRRLTITCLTLLISATAMAQSRQPTTQFDQLQVRELRAEDLTEAPELEDPSAILTVSPDTRIAQLDEEEMLKLLERAHANTVIITALHMPPEPFEQVPTISQGHGVWLTLDAKKGGTPVLVSSIDWLKDAKEIYVEPGSAREKKKTSDAMPGVEMNHSLESITVGKASVRAFNKKKSKLVELVPLHADRMRGMIALTPKSSDDAKKLKPPTGLQVVKKGYEGSSLLFGFTPVHADQLAPTSLLPARPTDESLSFYFQTTYPPIFGAPILDEKGRVVTINALRHPQQPERSLAIPPGAMRQFIEGALQAKK